MKAQISLVIAIMAAALAVVVPSAFADPGLDGAPDMSSIPASNSAAPYVDAFERPETVTHADAPDWFERAAAASVRDASAAPYVDAFERPEPVSTETTSQTVDSGTSIAWGQIGVAFGFGLLLALGLMLAVRSRASRPVAQ